MATGFARGAAKRGKRIAFGDGTKIAWSKHTEIVFQNNPNIALPGSEGDTDIEWNSFRAGCRGYHIKDAETPERWVWNMEFRAPRGELIFTDEERDFGRQHGKGFVIIEPNVMATKQFARNKQWPFNRYDELAGRLRKSHEVVQFNYGGRHMIRHVRMIRTKNFRRALAALQHASLFIGGDGGLHHACAALGVPAVIIFGSFAPPSVTGYPEHTNISADVPCGSKVHCPHCVKAMQSIQVDQVHSAARDKLAHG